MPQRPALPPRPRAPRRRPTQPPPQGRRPAPPAPARIWPRLAHTPPRRPAPGNRPIPAPPRPHGPVSAPSAPARPRPASPGVCLRTAPPAPLARLLVWPRRLPSKPAALRAHRYGTVALCPGDCQPRNGAVPPRPGPKGLCPQGGDQIPKSGALETAAPSRVNFREIRDPGFWLQKQKSAGFEGSWKPR